LDVNFFSLHIAQTFHVVKQQEQTKVYIISHVEGFFLFVSLQSGQNNIFGGNMVEEDLNLFVGGLLIVIAYYGYDMIV